MLPFVVSCRLAQLSFVLILNIDYFLCLDYLSKDRFLGSGRSFFRRGAGRGPSGAVPGDVLRAPKKHKSRPVSGRCLVVVCPHVDNMALRAAFRFPRQTSLPYCILFIFVTRKEQYKKSRNSKSCCQAYAIKQLLKRKAKGCLYPKVFLFPRQLSL